MFTLMRKLCHARPARRWPAGTRPSRPRNPFRQRPHSRVLPEGAEAALFGLGCFWGAERYSGRPPASWTAVGYAGGPTPNPTYEEVCSGCTGHTEAVLVVFDPTHVCYAGAAQTLLGEPQPDAGHAARKRCGHAIELGPLLLFRGAAGQAEASSEAYEAALK